MPYLYTVAEETSRTGLPINRPLFLEFPHATADSSPLDLTTGGAEFLVGSHLLVAPNPSPEEIAPYTVDLPPGTWYDYWTGEQFTRAQPKTAVDQEQRDAVLAQKPLRVTPKLDELPVYVRGGSILPIAPLVQSTAETPKGPLTLRIYPLAAGLNTPGETCGGEVYADDGHTLNYQKQDFARIRFTCELTADGALRLHIAKQEGRWKPWWTEYRLEVVGWQPKAGHAMVANTPRDLTQTEGRWTVILPARPEGIEVLLQ